MKTVFSWLRTTLAITAIALVLCIALSPLPAGATAAPGTPGADATPPDTIPDPGLNGVVPSCDPSLPPRDPAACGINAFAQLFRNIIKYLTFIAFPIAALMIGWGGIQIMTAAGNPEKVSKGLGAMKIAATGLVIILASFLIVQAIFKLLGVSSGIGPAGI